MLTSMPVIGAIMAITLLPAGVYMHMPIRTGAPCHRTGQVKQHDQFQRLGFRHLIRSDIKLNSVVTVTLRGCSLGYGKIRVGICLG